MKYLPKKSFWLCCFGIIAIGCSNHATNNMAEFICENKKNIFYFGEKKLNTIAACSQKEQTMGLMFVEKLEENSAMVFVFNEETHLKFWMKNTLIPLDIAFVDKNLTITEIQTMFPQDETITISQNPSIIAIETNKDWFKKNNIKPQDKITKIISSK